METANVKLCECGKCGLPAPIAKRTDARRGHVKGQAMRFIAGHRASRRDRMIAGDWRNLAKPAEVAEIRTPWVRWAAYCMAAFLVGGAHFGFARIAALAAKIVGVVALVSLAVSGSIAVALVAVITYRAIRPKPEKAAAVPVPVPEKLADAVPQWFAEVTELQAAPGILRSGSWTDRRVSDSERS
jgi:hypothetical protein